MYPAEGTEPARAAPVLAIDASIDRADIPALCDRLRDVLQDSAADHLICDVGSLSSPDAVAVDALARLHLTAQRLGCRVRLRNASPALRTLLRFTGLHDVLVEVAPEPGSVEPGREIKKREQRLGVEERVEADDPIA